jgi:hypothetical protein
MCSIRTFGWRPNVRPRTLPLRTKLESLNRPTVGHPGSRNRPTERQRDAAGVTRLGASFPRGPEAAERRLGASQSQLRARDECDSGRADPTSCERRSSPEAGRTSSARIRCRCLGRSPRGRRSRAGSRPPIRPSGHRPTTGASRCPKRSSAEGLALHPPGFAPIVPARVRRHHAVVPTLPTARWGHMIRSRSCCSGWP